MDAFKWWCWRRLWRVLQTARRSNQSILKEINPEYSLERLMLKLQYFGHLMWRDPDAGIDWGQEEKGTTEDKMVEWHHWLNGHGFGWTPGVVDGLEGLACCGSWGHKESDTTEWLNWTEQSYGHQNSNALAQRQKYRSEAQNRKTEINPLIYRHLIFEKGGKNIW